MPPKKQNKKEEKKQEEKKLTFELTKKLLARVKYRNANIIQYNFQTSKGATRDQIRDFAQKYFQKFKNQELEYMITARFPQGWRASPFEEFEDMDTARLENNHVISGGIYAKSGVANQDSVNRFSVFVRKQARQQGGKDDHNDCLWNCHKQATGKMPLAIDKPEKLKKLLGLKRDDPIDISHLPKYEEIANVSFEVSGDTEYISSIIRPIHIKLVLLDEHFMYDYGHKLNPITGMFFTPVSKENVYTYKRVDKDSDEYELFNGGKTFTVSNVNLFKYHMPSHRSIMIYCERDEDLSDKRQSYIDLADVLIAKTNNKINLYKYKKISSVSFDIWKNQFGQSLQIPEDIDNIESLWLAKSNKGGLHYAQEYEGIGYSYDMNGMYQYYMSDGNFKVPFTKPVFETLPETLEKEKIRYGVYRCDILSEHPLINQRSKYWTHCDLLMMISLGVKFKPIQDGQANAMIYDRNGRVSGRYLFKSFFEYMSEVKKNIKVAGYNDKYKLFKIIINSLWGYMSKKGINKLRSSRGDINIDDPKIEIDEIRPMNDDGDIEVRTINKVNQYKLPYARIGTFLTAYARNKFSDLILPLTDDIVRVNTDSFLLTRKLTKQESDEYHISLSDKLGFFKLEKQGQCKVINSNIVIFEK